MAQIRIDSILGGHSLMANFAAKDQFRASLGIDPSLPIKDSASSATGGIASGYLRPVANQTATGTIGAIPLWMRGVRGSTNLFVLDQNGSTYVYDKTSVSVTALADGGSLSSGSGNGLEYYDNYLYIAKNTDIARYGPLNTSDAVFDGSYWATTLSKTALSNTQYPQGTVIYPNHFLHRHSDGKLYIADVVNNQGVLHVISTTKTTQEGDTDNGSTYQKITFGYGLHPVAIESYGSQLVIAFIEQDLKTTIGTPLSRSIRAKLAFWDTVSQNFNSITWVEFPDPFITAMKNIDGALYVVSGTASSNAGVGNGFRISKLVGAYTFQEAFYSEFGTPPNPGAIDGTSRRLVLGSFTRQPESAASVFSLSLQKAGLTKGLFNIFRANTNATGVGCLCLDGSGTFSSLAFDGPVVGLGGATPGIDTAFNVYSGNAPSVWWSQMYKIGQPFQIRRVRIPLAQTLAANMSVTVKLYFDDGTTSQSLTAINSTNFPSTGPGAGLVANIKTAGDGSNIIMGQNNFWIELRWDGTALCTVALPIVVEFDVIPD